MRSQDSLLTEKEFGPPPIPQPISKAPVISPETTTKFLTKSNNHQIFKQSHKKSPLLSQIID
jgi:hypothetical protein